MYKKVFIKQFVLIASFFQRKKGTLFYIFLLYIGQFAEAQIPVQQFWQLNQSTVSDTLVWDVGPWNRQIDNGPGTLLTTNPIWTANKGKTNQTWRSCKNAVFGGNSGVGAAGTVLLGAAVNNVRSISFFPVASGSFTINSQSITTTCATDLPVFVATGLSPIIGSTLIGTNSITKNGTGTLILTGANTYAGTTTVNGGTLQIGNGGAAGSIPSASQVNITNNATLFWNIVNGSQTFANPITGAGAVKVNVAGNMSFDGGSNGDRSQITNAANTYSGGTILAGGYINANTAKLGTGTVTMNGGGLYFTNTMTWNSNNIDIPATSSGYLRSVSGQTATVAIPISGAGTLNFPDSGAKILTANNPFTGNIVMGTGDLSINGTGTLGSGNFSGTISNPNARSFYWNSSTPQTFNGVINGTNGYFLFNPGSNTTLTGGANVPGSNWYLNASSNGATVTQNISGGTYLFNNYQLLQNNFSNDNLTLTISGGNLTFASLGMGSSTAGNTSNNINTLTLTGGTVNVTGTFFPYKWATNYVNITNATMTANTYHVGWVDSAPTCYITVNSGGLFGFSNLQVDGTRNNNIYLNGGTLRPCSISAGTFSALQVQTNGGTIDNNGSNISIGQVISGAGNLTFAGSGAIMLTASNTYTGSTTINSGTLMSNSAAALGTGAITINNGGTLTLNADITNAITVNTGGILNKNSHSTGLVTGSGTVNP